MRSLHLSQANARMSRIPPNRATFRRNEAGSAVGVQFCHTRMPKDTLTLVLDGQVTLSDFAAALNRFSRLISALEDEVAHGREISWTVESLEAGSAIATVKGAVRDAHDAPYIEKVVAAYETTGRALQGGSVIPFRSRVKTSAEELAAVIGGSVRGIRFETADMEAEVQRTPAGSDEPREQVPAIGAVTGKVQTMSSRNGLRFTIWEIGSDKAVSCYLRAGMEEKMRDAWGKIATVHGAVSRDTQGRPSTVRDVNDVSVLDSDEQLDYRAAFGALPIGPGEELPEVAIRRLRDDA